jgi:sigma-B regulation protein RsbU (phosphoserine phosphatase)
MKSTGEKKRITLTIRIALVFIISIAIGASMVLVISQRYLFKETVNESAEVAQAALIGAIEIIWTRDPELTIFEDKENAEKAHQSFRDICHNTGLRYLYLYNVEEDGKLRYIVCAADTDDDDIRMNTEYGFGGIQERELYDAEVIALSGDPGGAMEIIDNDFGYVCMWVTPLLSRNGEVKGLIGADYDISNIVSHTWKNVIIFGVVGFFAFLLTFILSVSLMHFSVVNPIRDLSMRMSLFTKEKKAKPANHKTRFSDEITDIEGSFNSMALEIENYIGHIEQLTREKVQHQTQLDVARRIQCGIVPDNTELKSESYDIYGFSRPAWQVGGDFYDIIQLKDNRVFMVIGDVSGKGISAALFMMMIKSALREKIRSGMDLDKAFNEANADIIKTNPECMFATVFAAILDYEEGMLYYANAGHNEPILFGKEIKPLAVDPGIALGIFDDADIKMYSMPLEDNDGIVLYTDGFVEAVDTEQVPFGEEGINKAISTVMESPDGYTSKDIVSEIVRSTDEFTKELEQFDDMTCISLIFHKRNL